MTVRAFVPSGSGRDIAVADAAETKRDLRLPGATSHPPAQATSPQSTAAPRCSPDPCQHTDRYRLVTPFSLRL